MPTLVIKEPLTMVIFLLLGQEKYVVNTYEEYVTCSVDLNKMIQNEKNL